MYAKTKPLPGQLENCEICSKRFTVTPYSKAGPDGGLVCTPCGKELAKDSKAAEKAARKPATGKRRRKLESNRLDGIVTQGAKTLQQLCIEKVAQHHHDIEEVAHPEACQFPQLPLGLAVRDDAEVRSRGTVAARKALRGREEFDERLNANGARAKSGGRTVPAGGELIRLYADYLHLEYGDVGSDYVFINIWAEPRGQAWSYPAVYDLVSRLRTRIGPDFDPHWFRHSAATRWLRDGVPVEIVSKLLGHSSVTVTSAIYGHLTAEDARAALEKAGWFTGKEVSW